MTSKVNVEQIQNGTDRIYRVVDARCDGWANEEARREIFDACNLIEHSCGPNNHIVEKVGDIRIAADKLFSARKHLKFAQGDESGIIVLRSRIRSCLGQIKNWQHILEDRERFGKK